MLNGLGKKREEIFKLTSEDLGLHVQNESIWTTEENDKTDNHWKQNQ